MILELHVFQVCRVERFSAACSCFVFSRYAKSLALLPLLFVLCSCESIGFYAQAARGQFSLVRDREPIEELVKAAQLDASTKEKLHLVMRLREFASTELAMDVGDSYSSYVDLQRPYVVWNVTAAPEFAIEPKTWCFPIAGCVSYRGYFAKRDAEDKAAALRSLGYDVYLRGVGAYSTLGWFDDPVLNTFVSRSEQNLAALLFHELSHRQLYVKDDTQFNESFATAVAIESLSRWFSRDASDALKFDQYMESRHRSA